MVSFIIPAFNEASVLGDTLSAIHAYASCIDHYEVIVVNNNSTDATREVAEKMGANVIDSDGLTIASIRNEGVANCKGNILVFLDADVLLTQEWQININAQLDELYANPHIVTGSRCHPPSNNNWLNVHWYSLMKNQAASYINSGHLITTRKLFNLVGGFTDNLETAEDHDFCQKVKQVNGIVKPNFSLVTIHDGYPKTLRHFIQRERWHGKEDFKSVPSILESKVALIALLNILGLILFVYYFVFADSTYAIISYLSLLTISTISLTIIKFKRFNINVITITSMIHFFYILGRSFAFIDQISGRYSVRFREQG